MTINRTDMKQTNTQKQNINKQKKKNIVGKSSIKVKTKTHPKNMDNLI